jgi:hypothetical protein
MAVTNRMQLAVIDTASAVPQTFFSDDPDVHQTMLNAVDILRQSLIVYDFASKMTEHRVKERDSSFELR